MKRIVIDARESGTTTGRYVDKLVEYLHRLRPTFAEELDIVILTKTHRVDFMHAIAPKFEVVATPYAEFSFGEQLGFRRQIEGLKPDLVHFGMVQQPVWYEGPVVTTMHDLTTIRFRNPSKNLLVFTIKQSIYKWVNKRVAHKSAQLITPTEFVKQDVAEYTGADPAKITVTLESADHITDKPRALQSLSGDDFLMYVGRPLPHKNLQQLINAFAIIKDSHPQLKLVLVGKQDANYVALGQSVHARHLNDVVFTGFASEGQLRWLYENCQAYAFPSLSEGFGLPGLEAMMHGAPVVASNATCIPEVLGNAAHYFDPLDVDDMAAKIAEVLDDKKLRTHLIKAGRARVKKFSWERMAEQTLGVYKDVLASDASK